MNEDNSQLPVLVTGATGYIASWVVKYLLEKGHTVHATVRDISDNDKKSHLDKIASDCNGQLKYYEADLLKLGSYKNAMENCQFVFHIASPFIMDSKDPQKEIIDPALEGTKNILKSVNETSSVKRVVLTSSVAAIYGDGIDSKNVPNGIFDETMWNTSSTPTSGDYSYSKTVAEKEAWRICEEQNRWDLISINPSFVLGPALNVKADFESKKFALQLGNGDLKSGAPDITLGMVDVRDVADAHVKACFNESIKGRFILSSESISLLDAGLFIKEKFGDKYPVPTRNAPKFIIWLMAPFIGIKRNFVSRNIGYKVDFDNTKSKSELNIKYRPISQSVTDFFQQFIDEKLV